MHPLVDTEAEKLPSLKEAWISIREISQMCHMGQSTVRKLIGQNVIPHIRVGRKIVIPREVFFCWWNSEALNLRIPPQRR